jgi:hypothetical protein
MLDHDEDVEATQEHGIDVGEVDGRIAWACAARSCRQVGQGRCGADRCRLP